MEYRSLGRTGLEVSVAGIGSGGPSRLGQSTHGDEGESIKVIRRGLELGVNLIDTASAYAGSEGLVGKALHGVPRHSFILSTKFTIQQEGQMVTPADVVASCEESLRRLRIDVIDLFFFHGVLLTQYQDAVERLYGTVQRLREQGKVRFIGISEQFRNDGAHNMMVRAVKDNLWDVLMLKYGILNSCAEREVLPAAQERNIGILNMASVRQKVPNPKLLEEQIQDWKQRGLLAEDALPDLNPLGFLVHGGVGSVIAAAYKFALGHDAVHSVIMGTGSVAHLESNVEALLGPPLPEPDARRIRELFGGMTDGI